MAALEASLAAVDKPKNGTASRPPGWACPRHGAVI
jgi:hypothetical protein